MSLCVYAYSGLRPHSEGEIQLHNDAAFPEHGDGLSAGSYVAWDQLRFSAGSYSGYNEWRKCLASMVGIGDLKAFWKDPDMSHPFAYLLHFTDCDGYLGPAVCCPLAEMFRAHEAEAEDLVFPALGPVWMRNYQLFRIAFEFATVDARGAVEFS